MLWVENEKKELKIDLSFPPFYEEGGLGVFVTYIVEVEREIQPKKSEFHFSPSHYAYKTSFLDLFFTPSIPLLSFIFHCSNPDSLKALAILFNTNKKNVIPIFKTLRKMPKDQYKTISLRNTKLLLQSSFHQFTIPYYRSPFIPIDERKPRKEA